MIEILRSSGPAIGVATRSRPHLIDDSPGGYEHILVEIEAPIATVTRTGRKC